MIIDSDSDDELLKAMNERNKAAVNENQDVNGSSRKRLPISSVEPKS